MSSNRYKLSLVVTCFIASAYAAACTFAQEPEAAKAANSAGNAWLDKSRLRLAEYQSVKADMRQAVAIGARRFQAKGDYMQATNGKLRINLVLTEAKKQKTADPGTKSATAGKSGKSKKPAAALQTSILKVCDGRILWTQMQFGKEKHVERCDVQEVNKSLGSDSIYANSAWLRDLGMGGLKSMLAALDANLDFKAAEAGKIEDTEFQMITGTWKEERRKQMLGEAARPEDPLPPFVPDFARVYFDKETLFPRRVMYLKQHPEEKHKARPMLTLDFVNVQVNQTVAETAFQYTPEEGIPQRDTTDATIKQLKMVTSAGKPAEK